VGRLTRSLSWLLAPSLLHPAQLSQSVSERSLELKKLSKSKTKVKIVFALLPPH
jgi:hypothetical protein